MPFCTEEKKTKKKSILLSRKWYIFGFLFLAQQFANIRQFRHQITRDKQTPSTWTISGIFPVIIIYLDISLLKKKARSFINTEFGFFKNTAVICVFLGRQTFPTSLTAHPTNLNRPQFCPNFKKRLNYAKKKKDCEHSLFMKSNRIMKSKSPQAIHRNINNFRYSF
jgi:hypothetical protein